MDLCPQRAEAQDLPPQHQLKPAALEREVFGGRGGECHRALLSVLEPDSHFLFRQPEKVQYQFMKTSHSHYDFKRSARKLHQDFSRAHGKPCVSGNDIPPKETRAAVAQSG